MSEIEDLEKRLANLKKQREEGPSSEIDRYLYLRTRKEDISTDLDEIESELSDLEDIEAVKNYEPMTHKEFLVAVKACAAKPKHEIKECIEEELQDKYCEICGNVLLDRKMNICFECKDKEKKEKEEETEECPACKVAVGIGMYLNICKEDLDSEENCMKLYEKVTSEEITPEEFFNLIKEKAKDKPKELDLLECIDEQMKKASEEPPTPLISPYEENWGQWWDGMDSSERGELSKKISVRSVDFFELTEEEKEAIRSYAAEESIL